jgi:hypothetical protein
LKSKNAETVLREIATLSSPCLRASVVNALIALLS